jgi:uncharacterized protein YndB with AHSA1/START domain
MARWQDHCLPAVGRVRHLALTAGLRTVVLAGQILEADSPHRLVTTFDARWDPAVAEDPPSRATWQIEPVGAISKLTVTHDGFDTETATYQQISEGLPIVISGLKTLLETGAALPIG